MIWLPVVGEYADIDVYASTIAYTDLLNQRGKLAKSYIPLDTPNYSVPNSLRMAKYEGGTYDLRPDDEVIILDISSPEEISKFASDSQILELIDHHPGYEDYWRERLGNKSIIEQIGAVATSIFEWWGECWDYGKMPPEIAKLLLAAILDNTLYFNAAITTERDHAAAEQLAKIIGTTVDEFAKWYFSAVSQTIISDPEKALVMDCKTVDVPELKMRLTFGQLTIWDAKDILPQSSKIADIMRKMNQDWLVNIICLAERRNYLLVSSGAVRQYFSKLLDATTSEHWLVTDRLFLRKEIIAKILQS